MLTRRVGEHFVQAEPDPERLGARGRQKGLGAARQFGYYHAGRDTPLRRCQRLAPVGSRPRQHPAGITTRPMMPDEHCELLVEAPRSRS